MDNIFRSIALSLLVFFSYAESSHANLASLLALPTVSSLSSGATTTLTVGATNAQLWAGSAPVISGASAIDAGYVASGAAFLTRLNLGTVGAVLATVPVVASASIAASVACVASVLCAASLATAGATIAYLSSHNLAPVPGGGVGTVPNPTASQNGTYCDYSGYTCATTLAGFCTAVSYGTTTQGDIKTPAISGGLFCDNTHYYPGYPSSFYPNNLAVRFTSNGTCPSGYSLVSGVCTNTNSTPTPITTDQANTSLAATPPTPTQTQAINAELAAASKATGNNYMPTVDPNTATITAPAPVISPTTQNVTPTGQTQSASTTTTCSQASAQSIACTSATTTTTTQAVGSPVVTVTNNAPEAKPTTDPKTDCDKYPKNIGCSEYGTVAPPETIPVTNIPLSNAYTSWGSGSCPSSVALPHGVTFKYDAMCGALVILKPILIAMGLLISMFIVSGGVKE